MILYGDERLPFESNKAIIKAALGGHRIIKKIFSNHLSEICSHPSTFVSILLLFVACSLCCIMMVRSFFCV